MNGLWFSDHQQMGLEQGSEASPKREQKSGFLLANQAASDSKVLKGLSLGMRQTRYEF